MEKVKLLDISPFPWKPPFHGGQHRVFNILKKYKDLGVEVQSVGLNPNPQHYRIQSKFIPCDDNFLKTFSESKIPMQMEDFYLGNVFFDEDEKFRKLSSVIDITPDIIQVEHPWLFKFALKYAKTIKPKPKLVYSSHNIEYLLKEQLLKDLLTPKCLKEEIEKIKILEEFVICNSDYVVCCTENDANYVRQFKPSTNILVCPNGVRTLNNIPEFDIKLPNKYAIFCGSGHPPNIKGLYENFKGGLGCIAPDQRLIIVGSVGYEIMIDKRFDNIPNFRERTILLGEVEESLMNYLLSQAHVVILPLTVGGGSSLKTAEALYLGKWVVATDCALRGFERFRSSRGVLVPDDRGKNNFCQLLRRALDSELLCLSPLEKKERDSLLWNNTLNDLIKIVSQNGK